MEVTRTAINTGRISRETVINLSESLNEPEWFRDLRLRAWEAFENTPMPTLQDEEWRRTDIRALNFDNFQVPLEASSSYLPESSEDHRSGFAQFVDGRLVQSWLDDSLAAKGVIMTDLSTAAREYPDLLRQYLFSVVPDAYSKFAALANAFGNGVFVYVPNNVQVDLPVQISFTLSRPGLAVFPRSLVVAERGSSLAIIERYYTEDWKDEPESLSVAGAEVVAGEGSQLRYVSVQELGRNFWHFLVQRHKVLKDAQENSLNIGLGGKLSKSNVETIMAEKGGVSELLGIYFGDDSQFFDYHTLQDHAQPNCTSDLLYKGVLKDTARAVFSGLIKVRPGAQKTDAYQTNRNLLLSDSARADSIPNLEIEANDVRCSHGASVGPIDKEQLFYLMARGLSRKAAERMIVDGFFEPIVNRIPLEGVRDRLLAAIDKKME